MTHMPMTARILTALVLLFPLAARAQPVEVFRSVDAQGNMSFSDRPPPETPSERITVDAAAPPPSPEVAERRAEMSRVADELRLARREREAIAAAQVPPWAPAAPAYSDPQPETIRNDYWLPLGYPRPRPRPPWAWPVPPERPPPIPRPNPDSRSPRGLQEKLRQLR